MALSATRARGGSRGFGVVHLCAIIAIVMMLAVLTIPPLLEMTRRARTSEAVDSLAEIYRGSVAYYAGTRTTQSLAPVTPPRQFPMSVGITPATVPAGVRVTDPPATWRQPSWQSLNFAIDDAHYFSYEYESAGTGVGAAFTARAMGDLDGNGVRSTYERAGRATEQLEVESSGGLWVRDPVE